jgi:hypothetical protein
MFGLSGADPTPIRWPWLRSNAILCLVPVTWSLSRRAEGSPNVVVPTRLVVG